MINILFANDQPIAVNGFQHLINEDPELKKSFAVKGLKTKDLSMVRSTDIIFLALNHRSDFSSIFNELKELSSKPKLIIYFDENEFSIVMSLLRYGLSGLVSQRSASWELVNCLRQVSENGSYICRRSAQKVFEYFRIRRRKDRKI